MGRPKPDLDLGSGYTLRYTRWDPDLSINPQYQHLADQLPVERWGAIIACPHNEVGGHITFDGPVQRELEKRGLWQVESWDPLTISPSILMHPCECHGFIRDGVWVKA